MKCSIEKIHEKMEEAWILTIASKDVPSLLILLLAYKYDKIERIGFVDTNSNLSFQLDSLLDPKGIKKPIFSIEGKLIFSSWIWFDAVIAMLLDVHLLGWRETSHLDYEFHSDQGDYCINITVSAP